MIENFVGSTQFQIGYDSCYPPSHHSGSTPILKVMNHLSSICGIIALPVQTSTDKTLYKNNRPRLNRQSTINWSPFANKKLSTLDHKRSGSVARPHSFLRQPQTRLTLDGGIQRLNSAGVIIVIEPEHQTLGLVIRVIRIVLGRVRHATALLDDLVVLYRMVLPVVGGSVRPRLIVVADARELVLLAAGQAHPRALLVDVALVGHRTGLLVGALRIMAIPGDGEVDLFGVGAGGVAGRDCLCVVPRALVLHRGGSSVKRDHGGDSKGGGDEEEENNGLEMHRGK
ncbi:hypothetical protein BO86DRAFT_136027 [Aspergillus japonicus CBS 114.51]|uniref:Uncharacterized protein n=1 Tax=Aspergillus japonicus CBS 114.51 TaxID=1448312 RepID=A0A8T8WXB4_ASPJA|nr:hypothetical protein BO86DRAFT_136027 [Aspergillus japonicus CBS 114.51]RAH80032.1 hypothetical protein BO86DRAFT_136027 [Aspergillus japonicus CBS 114.51]